MSKLKFENVKEEIEKENWSLISTSYSNLKTDLEMKCPNGHLNVFSLERWRRGHKCPICEQNPYNNIKNVATKKEGYRILGFDQATITSGWAVFDDETLVNYGKWTSQGNSSPERIALTKGWVAAMIQKWNPDLIVFEDIQLQKFGNNEEGVLTFKKLAHLQGVLENYCYEVGRPYKIVPVATWRNFNEIKGKSRTERKKNAQIKIKRHYDVNVSQDEADAILISRYAAHEKAKHKLISFI